MLGERRGSASRRSVRIAALTFSFALLTLVPYGVAALRAPPHSRFTGLMTLPADQMWDLAAQRDVAHGLGQANRYTAERHAPALVAPLYPALGAIQRFSHLPQNLVYHLPRLIVVLVLPVIALWFFGLCFPEGERTAVLATILALMNVGLGPLLAHPSRISDFGVPESNTLVSATTSPHFAVAQVGLLVLFASLLLALRGRSVRHAVLVAIAGTLLVCISHPFLVLPFFLALGVAALVSLATRHGRTSDSTVVSLVMVLFASMFTSLPFLIVVGLTSRDYASVQGYAFPSTPADAWWTWVLGFGVVVPLAVAGLVRLVVRREIALGALALVAWLACQAPLICWRVLPFQRRFSEGLMFPLAGLAAFALAGAWRAARTDNDERRNLAVSAVVGVAVVLAVMGAFRLSSAGLFMNTESASAMRAVHRGDVVLAGDQLAAVLPGLSDGVVYLGRRVETVAWSRKVVERKEFVAHPAASWDWLRRNGITTLVVDRRDPTFLPREAELDSYCFRPDVHHSSVTVYRVLAMCAPSR